MRALALRSWQATPRPVPPPWAEASGETCREPTSPARFLRPLSSLLRNLAGFLDHVAAEILRSAVLNLLTTPDDRRRSLLDNELHVVIIVERLFDLLRDELGCLFLVGILDP